MIYHACRSVAISNALHCLFATNDVDVISAELLASLFVDVVRAIKAFGSRIPSVRGMCSYNSSGTNVSQDVVFECQIGIPSMAKVWQYHMATARKVAAGINVAQTYF